MAAMPPSSNLGLLMQQAAVGLIVLGSVAYVVHSRAPGLARRLRVAVALPLVRETRPGWMKRIGRWIAPPRATIGACGHCSGCDPGTGR